MDQDQVKGLRELIEMLKTNGVAEFDIEQAEFKVRLEFAGDPGGSGVDPEQLSRFVASLSHPAAVSQEAMEHAEPANLRAEGGASSEESLHMVKSPIVGTFYESPSPGAPSFIKLGDQVEVGQVLCIIEAMKLMNEIEADVAGEVVKRIAASGQPVEYGQPLFAIRPR